MTALIDVLAEAATRRGEGERGRQNVNLVFMLTRSKHYYTLSEVKVLK